ncbi:RND transporter, partial [Azospirillum formosense]
MTTIFGRRARLLGTALGALTLLSACAVGPDYERPSAAVPPAYKEGGITPVAFAPPVPRDDGWRPAAPGQAEAGPWWTVFNDPVLHGLMQRVEVDNQSLKAAEAAYRQAKALSDQARSAFFPVLSINGGADRVGRVGSGDRATSGTGSGTGISRSGTPVTTYDAGLGASWAPDLWGRIRRSVESNDANLQASAADLAAARLSAQAQLATAYI